LNKLFSWPVYCCRIPAMYTLSTPNDLDALLNDMGNRRVVMLGESTHGTHEFYTWRAEISKRLITEKGFDFIAVEADWPDSFTVNGFIKGNPEYGSSAAGVLKTFNRWPTWMWGNWETASLVEWLKNYNDKTHFSKKGFYGLDVYSLWQSMRAVLSFLGPRDPEASLSVQKAIVCFQPFELDEASYARYSIKNSSCRDQVVQLLKDVRLSSMHFKDDPEVLFSTEQNALVAVNAERYYHTMIGFDHESWNIRDGHMMETLDRLLHFHGTGSKAIIWAHNTHIGDARATEMKNNGMINIGQLARERYGEKDVYLVGFTSYQGSVIAGNAWGAAMQEMEMPPARKGSLEDELHYESSKDRYLLFHSKENGRYFKIPDMHRAIGVVYDPAADREKNYMDCMTGKRYDALVYIDHTTALHPFDVEASAEMPDSYPWGL
jgi:erythromycin esterase